MALVLISAGMLRIEMKFPVGICEKISVQICGLEHISEKKYAQHREDKTLGTGHCLSPKGASIPPGDSLEVDPGLQASDEGVIAEQGCSTELPGGWTCSTPVLPSMVATSCVWPPSASATEELNC